MFNAVFKNKLTYFLLSFYLLLSAWWIYLYFNDVKETNGNYLFGSVYSFIALIGGINGLFISKKWGGYKSLIGRGIMLFSLGLIGEWFGQTVWSYYNIVAQVEAPYPSIADIGYFSIIPFYALGALCIARAAGANFSLKSIEGKLILIIIPMIMITVSYFLYLKDLQIDFSNPIKTFLDYGYPLGEALTISIALLTYGLSRSVLGGKMKSKILFLIFALGIQYITDSTFLYMFAAGTYYNAGPVDMMYATSFFAMALGLNALNNYNE